jgi:hypothetical protein
LTLHPDKTRMLCFHKPSPKPTERTDNSKEESQAGTFDLLGFTHYWGRSLRGFWVVKRKTARNRLSRALRSIADWCRKNLHLPLGTQSRTLGQKLRGHFGYYGLTGNLQALQVFRHRAIRIWHKWLGRRRRQGNLSWSTFTEILQRLPLPPARVVHSVYRTPPSIT